MRRFGLSTKLLLTYVPLFTIAIVGSVVLTTQASEEQMLEQAKAAAFQKAHIVREALVNQMLENEMVDDGFLDRIRTAGGLQDLYIRIVPENLRLKEEFGDSLRAIRLRKRADLASAKGELGNEVFRTGSPLWVRRADDFEAIIPFKAEKKCQTCHEVTVNHVLGVAHIQLPLAELKAGIEANSSRTALISIGFAVVALGLGFLLYRTLIQKPLGELVAATEAIAQGSLSAPLRIAPSKDELGTLSRSFDRMRKALRQSQEALRTSAVGQIAGSLLRDFRAPMREITTAIDRIQSSSLEGEEKRKLCDGARNALQVMSKMTTDLLDFTTGELKVSKRLCSVGQIAEYVAASVRQDLQREEIELRVETEYTGNAVLDYDRMARALMSLITYAANYTPPGGFIKISTAIRGNSVVFTVEDNGSGIPKQFLDRVFEPFVKIVQERGVGLDLALAKRIVDMQGGTITVESQEGQGTTFTISMPAQ